MKFVLLIYQPSPFDPKSLPEHEYREISEAYAAVASTPNVTPGLPLGTPEHAVTVRVADGKIAASKGPHINLAGAVGGYFVFDAEGIEEAVQLAARVPAARLGGAIEVRPCEKYW